MIHAVVDRTAGAHALVDENEIVSAARRIARCCTEMLAAVDGGDATPGAVETLACDDFQRPAREVLGRTIPPPELKDLGMAFGDIATRMGETVARRPELDTPSWWRVRDFLVASHTSWGPYEFVVADNRRLRLVETPPPDATRFDLLAELATREGTEELRSAAEWVVTHAPSDEVSRPPSDGDADA